MTDMSHDTTLRLAGRRLREERERCGLRLERAAAELGVDKSTLSRIENGERGLDSIVLRRAAALYEVPMDRFFDEARGDLLIKARATKADVAAAEAMARWAQRKLDDLRFVREETSRGGE
jgi:transcriptional regulator with XRE-family HTH domain